MADVEPWEYKVEIIKNPDIKTIGNRLNKLGADGWELVSFGTTVKTWLNVTGNDLVLTLKRRGLGPIEPEKEYY